MRTKQRSKPEESPIPPGMMIHPSVEILVTYLDYYGFDYFLSHTLRRIDMTNKKYSAAVDDAILMHQRNFDDRRNFSLARTFRTIMNDLMEEEGMTEIEALETLAEDDYVIPVSTAMLYSLDAGEADIENLSTLIRSRAARLLERLEAEQA